MDNTLTQNPDVWGSYVTYGTRMGTTSPLADVDPQNRNQVLRRGSYLEAYGRGMYQSPYFTYRIRPGRNPFADYGTIPDVAAFDHGTPAGTLLSLLGAQLSATHAAAVFVSIKSPTSEIPMSSLGKLGYLQLDVPRSVSFSCIEAPNVDVTIKVNIYGSDFYGELKMYQASFLVSSAIHADLKTNATPIFDIPTSFYQIHAIKLVSFSAPITAGQFTINTGFNFGLPYRLDQYSHIIKYSQNDVQLSVNANAGIGAAQLLIEGSYSDPVNYLDVLTALPDVRSWQLGTPGPIPIGVDEVAGTPKYFQPGVVWGNYEFVDNDIPGSFKANNFYMATQTAYSPDNRGVVRPNLNARWTNHYDGSPGELLWDQNVLINFEPGSIMTVHYYVAGADFYQEQVKNIRKQWYSSQPGSYFNQIPDNSSIFQKLGYQDYASYDPTSNATKAASDPTSICDPADIRALKGPRPYYEAP